MNNIFFNQPFLQTIKDNERWTASDKDKIPIDIKLYKSTGRVAGAAYTNETSLTSLGELISLIPNIANITYYLDCMKDNLVCLDIEKTCPDDIKEKLLKLPYIYGEISLSGKGYHLLFHLPDNFNDFEESKIKKVLKEEHGYYELHLLHYITFTRNMIPESVGTENFNEFYAELIKSQPKTVSKRNIQININENNIPDENRIINLITNRDYKKTPDDFSGDLSRYEYGHVGFLCNNLFSLLSAGHFKERTYTDNQKAILLYKAAKEVLPYRLKHEETRENLPWLLYLAKDILSKQSSSKGD